MTATINVQKIEKRPVPSRPTPTAPQGTVAYFRGGGLRIAVVTWTNPRLEAIRVFNENSEKLLTILRDAGTIREAKQIRELMAGEL